MKDLLSLSVVESGPQAAVEAFNAVYSGYMIPMTMTLDRFERRFRGEDLAPFASRIWLTEHGRPAALLLIVRRGRASRFAALGVAPALRGRGVGRLVCEHGIEEARARGDSHVELEVLEGNDRARSLYRSAGFRDQERLFGFTYSRDEGPNCGDGAVEIEVQRGVEIGGRHLGTGDLPWMLEPATLAAATSPVRCFVDEASELVAFVDDQQPQVRLIGLLGALDPDRTRPFMASLVAHYPSRHWTAPALYPEYYTTGFFRPAGWAPSEFAQSRMRCPLRNCD